MVGVRRRSKPSSYHWATRRENACNFRRASRKSDALTTRARVGERPRQRLDVVLR